MTTHFSILAWRIPWTQEPGGLQSTGLQSRISLKWLSRMHAGASLVAQWLRIHLPMQETQFQPLGREDSMEKEMATHFNILAWEIPWTEEPSGLQSVGSQKSQTRLND